MNRKRSPTLHEKQIRWFTLFFGSLLVVSFAVLLWLMNHVPIR